MNEVLWAPAEWMDEMMPELAEAPSDFLTRGDDGVVRLVPIDDPKLMDDEERQRLSREVKNGEIVEFCWFQDHGDTMLTLLPDGGFKLEPEIPGKPSHWNFDEFLGDSAEELANLGQDP